MGKKKKLDCAGCSHCCDWVTFNLSKKSTPPDAMAHLVHHYRVRGCIVKEDMVNVHITVYSPCAMKRTDRPGCRIHGKGMPLICMRYDCRTDAYLPPGGKYNKR